MGKDYESFEDVADHIHDVCMDLGQKEFLGKSLSEIDGDFLDVRTGGDEALDEHVCTHASATGYFYLLKLYAKRLFDHAEERLEKAELEWNPESRKRLKAEGVGKPTKNDIAADVNHHHSKDKEDMEKEIDDARRRYEGLTSWLSALEKKGFAISQYAGERQKEIDIPERIKNTHDRVKNRIKKKKSE